MSEHSADTHSTHSTHSTQTTETESEGDEVVNRAAFGKSVKKWETLDDEIRDLEHNLREKKKVRQQHEEELLKIGDDFCINITGGKLTKTVTVRKAPIQEKQIKELVSKTEKDPQKIKKLLEDVETTREVKQLSLIHI